MQAVKPGLPGHGLNDAAMVAAALIMHACALIQPVIFGDALIQPGTHIYCCAESGMPPTKSLPHTKACLTQCISESAQADS